MVKIDKGGIDFDKAKNPGSNVTVNTSDSASMEKMKKNETTASSRRVLALSNDVKFTAEAPALAEETEL